MSGNASEDTFITQPSVANAAQIHGTSLDPLTNGAASNGLASGQASQNGLPTTANESSVIDRSLMTGTNAVAAQQLELSEQTNKRASFPIEIGDSIMVKSHEAPLTSARGRGRGGSSRARGRGRASVKGRKRKRNDGDDNDGEEDESEDSEVCAPTAVMTKSGRSVQRPTTFIPPAAPSPTSTPAVKKKRVWRKNPENAVCKHCLRGVSPASNMIVFCDGCNTPYHRWCHHPPIDQSVIDETDKEWYCRQCRRERIVPVPEADVAHFVAADSASASERQKFFAGLTPGALVTLLTRISTLHPDLPIFDPEFASKHGKLKDTASSHRPSPSTLGMAASGSHKHQPATIYVNHDDEDEDEGYGPEEHPAHYVRPGQGLMSTLPPDKEDEQHLVDEESSKGVFHHIYLVDEEAAKNSVNNIN
ncbi:hypothetical protein AMS68_000913 [Peltaster fructicola]|uniref:PHD-type domain-containing protein n=1 Tax=Peltaster fructicola TaxID=286661 RepID=A0A6H0XL04_9PEZI|nr:hypothetical protein AMS68_000913 [Peltaster fructicola]